VAAAWGESDLAPLLRWLARYSNLLEDRARLNRYRQAFMYVVSAAFQSKADRLARQAELNANPPTPGAILVKEDTETWEVVDLLAALVRKSLVQVEEQGGELRYRLLERRPWYVKGTWPGTWRWPSGPSRS